MSAGIRRVKSYLSSPLLLSPLKPRKELFLYLAVSPTAVSAALVREEERVQKPVYYASRVLCGAEERPTYGETRLCISYSNSQTQAILSSPYDDCPNRQAPAASDEQP